MSQIPNATYIILHYGTFENMISIFGQPQIFRLLISASDVFFRLCLGDRSYPALNVRPRYLLLQKNYTAICHSVCEFNVKFYQDNTIFSTGSPISLNTSLCVYGILQLYSQLYIYLGSTAGISKYFFSFR